MQGYPVPTCAQKQCNHSDSIAAILKTFSRGNKHDSSGWDIMTPQTEKPLPYTVKLQCIYLQP